MWRLINCVCKDGEKITHIGRKNGQLWSVNEAITLMLGQDGFFIQHQGKDIELHIIRDKPGGNPVAISSNPDGLEDNNLDHIDICDDCS
jgi:hypothetical protein